MNDKGQAFRALHYRERAFIILFEEACGEHASPQLARVFLSNAGWVIFPLIVLFRMWPSNTPFSSRKKSHLN